MITYTSSYCCQLIFAILMKFLPVHPVKGTSFQENSGLKRNNNRRPRQISIGVCIWNIPGTVYLILHHRVFTKTASVELSILSLEFNSKKTDAGLNSGVSALIISSSFRVRSSGASRRTGNAPYTINVSVSHKSAAEVPLSAIWLKRELN